MTVEILRDGTFIISMDDNNFRLLASKLLDPRKKKAFGYQIGSKEYVFADKYLTTIVTVRNGYKLIITELSDGRIIRIESVKPEEDIMSVLILDPNPETRIGK